ncbi:MAG: Ig-like domain-containing domain [Niabella sp.]
MQVKKIVAGFIATAITVVPLLFTGGCASIVPPSGGPRDSLAPVIVTVDPPNETTNFKNKTITIQFDEYVELNNPFENMVVSPLPVKLPEVKRKLKTVTVKLKDSLEENTTYSINFKNVIKDVNEGNRAKDLLYIFSTGTYFDSLQLSGNVKIARTGKPDSTLIVMLHKNLDDSAVVKDRPRYIAKLDTSGTFLFRYLTPGTYRLYALKDESGSYKYMDKTQIFGFADSAIVLKGGEQHDPVIMYAYAEEEEKNDNTSTEKEDDSRRLKFTTNLEGAKQDLLQAFIMKFETPLKNFDAEKITLTTDTTFSAVSGNRFTLDSTKKMVTMNMPWEENKNYNLVLAKDFATDSLGKQLLKTDTLHFTTKAKSEYGQVKLTFLNLDMAIHPVLLLMQNGQLKNAFPLKTNKIELQLINPGDYEMQILHDTNENSKWDPGAFFTEHRQPEMVTFIERKLSVKPNWSTEFEVRLP